jgi:regulator of RNase E activity RraA
MARQIGSMNVEDRRHAAAWFVGKLATVHFRKGWNEPIVGKVITVAVSRHGGADVIVVDNGPGFFPWVISLATVRKIEQVQSCGS